MSDATTVVVVPCFDEAERLPHQVFREFAAKHPSVRFLMVDDGSSDGTLAILRGLEAGQPRGFEVLALERNMGKAEAVRRGMLRAFESGAELAGYWDADLSTPLDEIPRFVEELERHPGHVGIYGARVMLLGRRIRRSALRHYLGRVFATAASMSLGLPVYDTQCGAKLFRRSDEAIEAFAEPFLSKWIFDVEILARLRLSGVRTGRDPYHTVREVPLLSWADEGKSKVRPGDFFAAFYQLIRIHQRYRLGASRRNDEKA